MGNDVRIATPCPRCGRAIEWAVYTRGGVEALEVADQACACALSREQWGELADRADARWEEWERGQER